MDSPSPTSTPETPAPKRRFRWGRFILIFLLNVLMAVITAALVYAIMLPAIMAPKSMADLP